MTGIRLRLLGSTRRWVAPEAAPLRSEPQGRRIMVVAAVLGLIFAACNGSASSPGPGQRVGPSGAPAEKAAPEPTPFTVNTSAIPVVLPSRMAVSGSTIWVVAASDVARIDVATGAVKMLGIRGRELVNIAATPTAIWVTDLLAGQLLRIDPATDKLVDRIDLIQAWSVLPVDGTIWVTNPDGGSIIRLDPTTDGPIDTVVVGGTGTYLSLVALGPGGGCPCSTGPLPLAEGAGSVWTLVPGLGQVVRLDPKTAQVTARIAVPGLFDGSTTILATSDAVWVTGGHATADIVRIDPTTNRVVAQIHLNAFASDPVLIDGALWVPSAGLRDPGELDRIDQATNTVDRRAILPGLVDVAGVVLTGGAYWVANGTDSILQVPLSEFEKLK